MIERHAITSREQWLALRKPDITASVVGALFGAHPYESALKLYLAKRGLEFPEPDSAVLRRGRLLESAVAEAAAEEKPNWRIERAREYLRDPGLRLGATPDFFIDGDPRGRGVLQAKTVAPQAFKKFWTPEAPPFWIVLQAATEAMLEGAAFGAVAALIVDPYRLELRLYEVPRRAATEALIRTAVADFWSRVERGDEPDPNYTVDAALAAAMYPAEVPAKVAELAGDNALPGLLAERAALKARIKQDEARCADIETELKFKMGDAEVGSVGGFVVSWRTHQRKAYTVPAASIRQLRITDMRPKERSDDGGPF